MVMVFLEELKNVIMGTNLDAQAIANLILVTHAKIRLE